MIYESENLTMLENSITDTYGTRTITDLPDPQPECEARLVNATPLLEQLWRVALWDIESNVKETENGRYFAGGAKFGIKVYTRDISYSGILGLNRFYPEIMRDSIEVTRKVRLKQGFKVSQGHVAKSIPAPWEDLDLVEGEYSAKFSTNSYTRRTDDVVWLWAMQDIFRNLDVTEKDWRWLYETGETFFADFYKYFHDESDGLYRGQASFIDIAWPPPKDSVGGYPDGFKVDDCVMLKAASTNALYVKGMRVMAETAALLGKEKEAAEWRDKEEKQKAAIADNLIMDDGRIAYFKDRHGHLSDKAGALGTALCILNDAVDEAAAEKAAAQYPKNHWGVPILDGFYDHDRVYHNKSSWPFVTAFFMSAYEKATREKQSGYTLALLARTVQDDGFHEVVDMRDGRVFASGHQLWSAAGFLNACIDAGLEVRC